MKKRKLSLFVATCLVFSCIPTAAFAEPEVPEIEEGTETNSPVISQVDVEKNEYLPGDTIVVSAEIADDTAVAEATMTLISPSNVEYGNSMNNNSESNTWTVSTTIPLEAEKGSWRIRIDARDSHGNSSGETVDNAFKVSAPISIESITLKPTQLVLIEGKTSQMSATILPANSTNTRLQWATSHSSIVSVTNEGIVKAVKTGKATVTATVQDGSNKKASCTISVLPSTVASPKAASASYNSTSVSWGKVAGADGYEVWRSTDNKTFKNIKSIASAGTVSLNDTSLSTNTKYYYKIRAYASANSVKQYSGYSSVVSATPIPAAPASPKAASSGYNSIKASWSKVAGASGYELHCSIAGAAYKNIKTITSGNTVSFSHTGLTAGKNYSYKVRAYRTVSGKKVYGSFSTVVSTKPVPAKPGSPKASSAGYDRNKISWSKVSGASGYEVLQSTDNKTFKNIKTITNASTLSYTKTGLTSGKTYYYKVRAYRTVSGKKVYGDYSAVVSSKPTPAKPTSPKVESTGSDRLKVTWKKVSGASGYEIQRSTSSGGTYTLVKTITSGNTLSFTNTGLSSSKTYHYKIRAFVTVNGAKVYSPYTSVVKATTKAATVYWVSGGSVYHKSKNCSTLSRSKNILSGTVTKSGKSRACKVCG